MNYLRKVVGWIDSLESGQQFRKWVSILCKIWGGFVLVGAVVWGIVLCVTSIAMGQYWEVIAQTFVIIGSILALCINVIVGIVIAMLFWNRSDKIRKLGDESHFTLLPIVVIFIRLFGEVNFLASIGIGLQVLIAPFFGLAIPGAMDHDIDFIFFGIISLVSSVIVLIFYYFIAELVNLLLDMATNLKKIETTLSDEEPSQGETNG